METFLIKAAQLIVALAILVVIHEFGHYIMARIFGIKVEKFYLFFNPWFSLAKWKPKKDKASFDKHGNERATWRDTEYGIGWLPLGGYVKIAGMIDESMDKEQLAKPAEPWEFRAKPAYQRLLVMIGGVLFNFILALIIYAGIAFCWGTKYIELEKAVEGMDFTPTALKAGFKNGDIPLLADGKKLDASKTDFMLDIVEAKTVTVLRDHHPINIDIPENFILQLNDEGFMTYRIPVYIHRVQGGSAASEAGFAEGDHIIAVDTVATPSFSELTPALQAYAGKSADITIERDGRQMTIHADIPESGRLGFQLKPITDVYPTTTIKYSLWESIPKGWELGTTTLTNYVGSMKYVFTKEGAKSLGGFGTLGNMFPSRWSWLSFWEITAFLSVALAFMNILPIPALDGGHVLFLIWEVITRRKPNEKVMEYAQVAGMIFLLLLLVYVNGNDIVRGFLK